MKKKNTKKLLIILIILIFMIIFFGFLAKRNDKKIINFIKDDVPVSLKLDSNQTNEEAANIQRIYNPDIVLPGWGELTIKANQREIGDCIKIYNPEANIYYNCPKCKGLLQNLYCPYCEKTYDFKEVDQNVYYLKFSIILKDNEELIYSTDLIKPGYHINNIILNKELEVGDYEISILIEPYKSDMATKCNSGEIETILHVTDTI